VCMESIHRHEDKIIQGRPVQAALPCASRPVADTGIAIVVTKRGHPVARVVSIEASMSVLSGSLNSLTGVEEELYSTGEAWDAEHSV
jgi:hypothetical protein